MGLARWGVPISVLPPWHKNVIQHEALYGPGERVRPTQLPGDYVGSGETHLYRPLSFRWVRFENVTSRASGNRL